jgi:hypothetical protein
VLCVRLDEAEEECVMSRPWRVCAPDGARTFATLDGALNKAAYLSAWNQEAIVVRGPEGRTITVDTCAYEGGKLLWTKRDGMAGKAEEGKA